jgi:hypothetical protein
LPPSNVEIAVSRPPPDRDYIPRISNPSLRRGCGLAGGIAFTTGRIRRGGHPFSNNTLELVDDFWY